MKLITKDQTENLRWMLRRIGTENGYSFDAFEITAEGAYIYYKKKKLGPITGITYSEDWVRREIVRLLEGWRV